MVSVRRVPSWRTPEQAEAAAIAYADRKIRTGYCDEAPFSEISVAAYGDSLSVQITGNPAYFDGETEIMDGQIESAIEEVFSAAFHA